MMTDDDDNDEDNDDNFFFSPQLIIPEISWQTCTETGLLVDSRAIQINSKDQPSHKQPEAIFKP